MCEVLNYLSFMRVLCVLSKCSYFWILSKEDSSAGSNYLIVSGGHT